MDRDLEELLEGDKRPRFKSEGERKIAYFLDDSSIRYQYEPALMVSATYDKPRIWYPDFYLPEFGAYIEYYGLRGMRSYDSGIERKNKVYARMGLAVIPVYPWTFNGNWKGYIMDELEGITLGRYRSLLEKRSRKQKTLQACGYGTRTGSPYHMRSSRRY